MTYTPFFRMTSADLSSTSKKINAKNAFQSKLFSFFPNNHAFTGCEIATTGYRAFDRCNNNIQLCRTNMHLVCIISKQTSITCHFGNVHTNRRSTRQLNLVVRRNCLKDFNRSAHMLSFYNLSPASAPNQKICTICKGYSKTKHFQILSLFNVCILEHW